MTLNSYWRRQHQGIQLLVSNDSFNLFEVKLRRELVELAEKMMPQEKVQELCKQHRATEKLRRALVERVRLLTETMLRLNKKASQDARKMESAVLQLGRVMGMEFVALKSGTYRANALQMIQKECTNYLKVK